MSHEHDPLYLWFINQTGGPDQVITAGTAGHWKVMLWYYQLLAEFDIPVVTPACVAEYLSQQPSLMAPTLPAVNQTAKEFYNLNTLPPAVLAGIQQLAPKLYQLIEANPAMKLNESLDPTIEVVFRFLHILVNSEPKSR